MAKASQRQRHVDRMQAVGESILAMGDGSMRTAFSPSSRATCPVVPLPANGSSTVSPGLAVGSSICLTSERGHMATCR